MKRNLRFWTWYTWENMEMELIVVGIFLVIGLLTGDPVWGGGLSSWASYLALVPFYLIIAAVICVMIVALGCQVLYIPLLISHGEPRRNAFWGFQYHRLLLITATSAVSGLVWLLVPGELSDACLSSLPMIVTVLVIISAVGNLMGTAYAKWKWLGVVVMVVFFGTCGGLAGWLMSTEGPDIVALSLAVLGFTSMALPWQMVAVAAVLLAVDMSVQWLLLRRREVKF